MTLPTLETWTAHVRRTLSAYDEDLLRQVAEKLCRPRNQWPREELIERSLAALGNTPVLDRRLKDHEESARLVLALIGYSGQPCWPIGSLVEMLIALGHADGLAPLIALLEAGLLYPLLFPLSADPPPESQRKSVRQFDQWLSLSTRPMVFAHPAVIKRALSAAPVLSTGIEPVNVVAEPSPIHEADGWEWPLRLAVLFQEVAASPLRLTQQRDFFKKDLEKLRGDSLLSATPAESITELPDLGLFVVALGRAMGILKEREGQLQATSLDETWGEKLPSLLSSLWSALPALEGWKPSDGWSVDSEGPGNPFPAAQLLALVLLAQLPKQGWAKPVTIEKWIAARHPYWSGGRAVATANGSKKAGDPSPPIGIATFLLGVAYLARFVQAVRSSEGDWLIRLSSHGRWVMGLQEAPPQHAAFPQTLMVQPNLEILAYRQGLTPELIMRLGRFAAWKGLGPACTLQLEPGSVYRALESGESFASIVQILERHGMKALPSAVLDSLRTWSNKRDRISVFPAAALFEFGSPAELNDALSRGLAAVRLTDRLAVVASEKDIDYRHFRLTGTRDYCLPPEKCVDVAEDGITLSIDLARSDLLLETEVQGFADLSKSTPLPGRRLYQLTTASIARARANGLDLTVLAQWFVQRTGLFISPAARLLFTAAGAPPLDLRRQVILHASSEEQADGLAQYPPTRLLVRARLGPTALVVDERDVAVLQSRCEELGLKVFHSEG